MVAPGGYSDEELIGIVTQGVIPSRPGWKSTIPMAVYTAAHTWPKGSKLAIWAEAWPDCGRPDVTAHSMQAALDAFVVQALARV